MNYKSTRNNQVIYTSEQVLNYGLAPDGGLFIPELLPIFSQDEIKSLKGSSYYDIANFIMKPFLTDLFSEEEIKIIIKKIMPDPKGKPNEFTKSLSTKLAMEGSPGIIPSTIIPTTNNPNISDEVTPKKETFSDFLKYIINANAGIATKLRR